jgi:hypothetical protein
VRALAPRVVRFAEVSYDIQARHIEDQGGDEASQQDVEVVERVSLSVVHTENVFGEMGVRLWVDVTGTGLSLDPLL